MFLNKLLISGANATLLAYNSPQMLSLKADQRSSMKLTFVHLFSATDIEISELKKASSCFVGLSPLKLVSYMMYGVTVVRMQKSYPATHSYFPLQ